MEVGGIFVKVDGSSCVGVWVAPCGRLNAPGVLLVYIVQEILRKMGFYAKFPLKSLYIDEISVYFVDM